MYKIGLHKDFIDEIQAHGNEIQAQGDEMKAHGGEMNTTWQQNTSAQ